MQILKPNDSERTIAVIGTIVIEVVVVKSAAETVIVTAKVTISLPTLAFVVDPTLNFCDHSISYEDLLCPSAHACSISF